MKYWGKTTKNKQNTERAVKSNLKKDNYIGKKAKDIKEDGEKFWETFKLCSISLAKEEMQIISN